jgi:23S rRNA (pseudouridine1915-N3)-methyltransferase
LKEAETISAAIPKGANIVAMCVEGKELSSPELAERLDFFASSGTSKLCFIIGGSDGLHDSIKNMAGLKLSMSKMTFPHHLARVMLLEQIYRAFNISSGGKYHK